MMEDTLYVAVADIVENAIGADLAMIGSGVNAKPAIFIESVSKQDPRKLLGLMPFVRIVMGIVAPQGSHKNARWYDDAGNSVTQTILDVDCTIQVVGGNATDLCRKIQQHLTLSEFAENRLCQDNIVCQDADSVRPRTTYLNNSAYDSAFFLTTLTTTDELVEESFTINTVDAGFHVRHHGSQEDIVSTTINIDNP